MNLFRYFSYFSTDMGGIRRRKSRHNAIVDFCLRENRRGGSHTLLRGVNYFFLFCTFLFIYLFFFIKSDTGDACKNVRSDFDFRDNDTVQGSHTFLRRANEFLSLPFHSYFLI